MGTRLHASYSLALEQLAAALAALDLTALYPRLGCTAATLLPLVKAYASKPPRLFLGECVARPLSLSSRRALRAHRPHHLSRTALVASPGGVARPRCCLARSALRC